MPELTDEFIEKENLGSLSSILGQKKEFKLTKEVMRVLFSDDEAKIIQSTEFNSEDIRMATIFEMIDAFIIEPFCFDSEKRKQWKTFKKRVYQMRVSRDRKGRTELFDAIKSDIKLTFKEGEKTKEIK